MKKSLSLPYCISPQEAQRRTRSLAPLLAQVCEKAARKDLSEESMAAPALALERYVQKLWNVPVALSINSERAALQIILTAAGVTSGTRVIISAFTSAGVIAAVNELGAEAYLVDIDEATMTISPSAVSQAVNEQTRAVIASHVCGLPPNMRELMRIAELQGIVVIEDATWAAGGHYGGFRYAGQAAGSVGDYGYIACSPGKPLMTMREGGLIFCRDSQDRGRLLGLRDRGPYHPSGLRWESMNGYDASLLIVELEHLSGWFDRRGDISARYSEAFAPLPCERAPDFPGYILTSYPLVTRSTGERESLVQLLVARGIIAANLELLPALGGSCEGLYYECGPIPVAETMLPRLISLPNIPELVDDEVDECIGIVVRYFHTARIFMLCETKSLVLNREQRSLALLSGEKTIEHQSLELDELALVTALLEAYPGYCSYKSVLAALTSRAEECCAEQVRDAIQQGTEDTPNASVRKVLSRCRQKLLRLGVDIVSILDTGYVLLVL